VALGRVRIEVSETTLTPRTAGARLPQTSARLRHHAKSEAAVAAFKMSRPHAWRKSQSATAWERLWTGAQPHGQGRASCAA
jgi:hypothetical protein